MATTEAATEVVRMLTGGEWRASRSTRLQEICNPATGDLLARVPFCLPDEVEQAVAAAAAAFPAWRDTPVTQRVRVLFRYRELLNQREDELARLTTREHGKTLEEARASVRRGIEVVEFACGVPTLLMGESVEGVGRNIDTVSLRQPLGVCVGIPPFNFPAMVPLWMFPLAVACGNTFVLKPSEKVPLTASRLAALFIEAGLPPGVLNVVHGGAEVVDQLLDHPAVQAVSFVGSSAVAQHVYARAASQGKRVQAAGGAKNHLVVLPDADLELAGEAVIGSAFGCAGERCLAGSVVVAVGAIADPLVAELCRKAGRLVVGDGLLPTTQMGPVISPAHRRHVEEFIAIGCREGARLILDGRARSEREGCCLAPSIFDDVAPGSTLHREEIFGPVLSVIRVPDLAAALAVVNASPFGNAGSVFSNDAAAIREYCSRVEAGMVGVNVGVAAPMVFMPFAGWKGSFYGDLHTHGKDGVRFYTRQKVITARHPWSGHGAGGARQTSDRPWC